MTGKRRRRRGEEYSRPRYASLGREERRGVL